VGLNANSSAGIAAAASARLRRIVACIALADAAIEVESCSPAPPSVVCAIAGTLIAARQNDNTTERTIVFSIEQ
jgi:hypothetical protein